ncbi:hypothetical protein PYJP_00750 [Pyrofollis japonicus]|uniref:DUF6062 family protein n=1 Tax=Pyrofollis japonicus TaxID=3060460 RepID=UPI00295AF2C3|nr:DUF6062 family protein [Pyrofollis japonicus]BEP16723.1 hypothetical protein PYJP_00750 [Pyrofollis japonicus]
MSEECRSIMGAYLREALRKPGCPICRLIRDAEERLVKSILYEYVNDPGVRREIRSSLGFCTHHAWLLLRMALSPEIADSLGAAIIYEDVVSTYMESLEKGRIPEEENECPVCRTARETEEIYVEEFSKCYQVSEKFREEYATLPAILCRRHLRMVLSRLPQKELRNQLLRAQLEKLKDIRERLERLIEKHDYRSQEPITRREQQALREAIEALRGREVATTLCDRAEPRRQRSSFLEKILGRTR